MKQAKYVFGALVLTLTVSPTIPASPLQFLVVPNLQATTAGNANSNTMLTNVDIREQEVFGEGQFASIPGSLWISQMAFRAVPGTGALNTTITSANLYLSTTQYAAHLGSGAVEITTSYATNLGPDNTLVFSGPLTLSSPGCTVAPPGSCPFDVVVNFSTPFLYNPTQGRLLLDLQATGYTHTSGDEDTEAYSFPPGGAVADIGGPLTSPTGTYDGSTNPTETSGAIVQFGFTVVPEPASWMLILGALGAVAAMRRRQSS